jgi:hypothetical protein
LAEAVVVACCRLIGEPSDSLGDEMKLHTMFVKEESGQSLVESTVFLSLMFILAIFALNFNYYIGFIHTVHASSARAAEFSAQGGLTGLGTLPSSAAVTTAAKNEIGNTMRNPNEAAPSISVCSPGAGASGACSGFTDPEASTSNTGTFTANSVQVTQTFTPFLGGKSVIGINLLPFTAPSAVTHTVYMRALN